MLYPIPLQIGFANGEKTINFFTTQTSEDGVHFISHGSVQNTGMSSGTERFTFFDSPVTARFVKLIFTEIRGMIAINSLI